jgi:hypothetical protein
MRLYITDLLWITQVQLPAIVALPRADELTRQTPLQIEARRCAQMRSRMCDAWRWTASSGAGVADAVRQRKHEARQAP